MGSLARHAETTSRPRRLQKEAGGEEGKRCRSVRDKAASSGYLSASIELETQKPESAEV